MMINDGKPDGGCLAWTIVASSFMVSFLQDGFRFSNFFFLDDWLFGFNYCHLFPHDLFTLRIFSFLQDAMILRKISQKISAALWTCFIYLFLNVNFRDSFGLLLPAIADHFKVGRAEAALTSSFMTLLTLGSGHHCILLGLIISRLFNLRTTGCSLVDLQWPPQSDFSWRRISHHRPPPLRPLHPGLHRPLHPRPLPHHRTAHWPGLWPDVPAGHGHR